MADPIDVSSLIAPPVLPVTATAASAAAATKAVMTANQSRDQLMAANMHAEDVDRQQMMDLTKQAQGIQEVINGKTAMDAWQAEQQTRQLAQQVGTVADPDHLDKYMLGRLASTQNQATDAYLKSAAELLQMQQVKFSDDPVQWIMNQYTMEDKKQEVDTNKMLVDGMADASQKLAVSVNTGAQQIKSYSAAVTQEDVARDLKLKSLAMQGELLKMDEANHASGAKELAALNQASAQQLTLLQNQQSANQRDRALALQEAEFAWRRQEKQANEKNKKIEDMANSQTMAYINAGARNAGVMKAYTIQDILVDQKLNGGKLGVMLSNFAINGQATLARMDQTGGADAPRYIATSPGQAAQLFQQFNLPGTSEMRAGIIPILKDSYVAASQKFKKPEEIQAAVNADMAARLGNWADNAEQAGSPLAVSSLQRAFATGTQESPLQQTKFYQTVLKPLVARGTDKWSANDMLTTATQALRDGKTTHQDAAAFITQFYTKGILQRQIDNNMSGLGFNPTSGYKARIDATGSIIDLTKYDQVLHTINTIDNSSRGFSWGEGLAR